jgi:2-oxoacid:acceptor oxidoreductase gamma subunit (pyruvate/2-ketoisovalerate family)
MREIRLHGRGGQGTVLAAEILVNAFVSQGRFASAIPFFGFERRGAPISAFVRFDDEPVREKTQIYSPDCIIVMDPTLGNAVDIFDGLSGAGIAVLNDRRSCQSLGLPPSVKTVGRVDATRIAVELLGLPITNTTMLGAFASTTKWVDLKSIVEGVMAVFEGRPLAEENAQAVEAGYREAEVSHLEVQAR